MIRSDVREPLAHDGGPLGERPALVVRGQRQVILGCAHIRQNMDRHTEVRVKEKCRTA
jgi:hypothetical protein